MRADKRKTVKYSPRRSLKQDRNIPGGIEKHTVTVGHKEPNERNTDNSSRKYGIMWRTAAIPSKLIKMDPSGSNKHQD